MARPSTPGDAVRADTNTIDPFRELLSTLAGALDVRTVFDRVSEIANSILPHDGMTMTFRDAAGEVTIQARSSREFVQMDRFKVTNHDDGRGRAGAFIVSDLQREPLPIFEPRDMDPIIAAGYRACLAVNAAARDQEFGLEFWSKHIDDFSADDIPNARRIAEHVAVAVSHEQLAEAARQGVERRVRAGRPDMHARSLADSSDVTVGHRRAVGESDEWKAVLKKAAQVGPADTTVLLTGESGTGKEVVARLIHRASPRKGGPFVALNCAALPEQLLESELFGHERGAFTGAQAAKPGQIELASGGVLFLDEVSEMSRSAQAKFLRVLQEREFRRLGGTRTLKANMRVIAASNRDLTQAVDRGDFREDLYYRIQVFEVHIPPLRERSGDILLLSEVFLKEIAASVGRPSAALTRDAENALLQHDWPGNVRELRNALERAVIESEGALITAEHLSLQRIQRPEVGPTRDLNVIERATVERVMRDTHWNKARAARRLGLSRSQLYVRLRKYALEVPARA